MVKILIVLGLVFAGAAHANPSGTLRVIDADTVDVGGLRVRLFGLDAPEIGQPCVLGGQTIDCGRWAGDLVRARFGGKDARCTTRDVDRYGRQVATCDVGGVDIGQVIVAEGFERIHRTNLVGMGVLPVEFKPGTTRLTLGLDGTETFDIEGELSPRCDLALVIRHKSGEETRVPVTCRLDTAAEVGVYEAGGVLQRFAKDFLGQA